jgi:histidinol-phosphatase (PHP family)
MKFDLHTHHERCGHAIGTIQDYIEYAYKSGLQVIGLSDHSPYFGHIDDHPQPHIAMARSTFPVYVNEILALKKQYAGKIEVLLGVESDYFPLHAETYRHEYLKYPFDYIIGSVHQVDGISIFNKNRFTNKTDQQKVEIKESYYKLIQQSAKSKMFQILGHIDAMKAFYPSFSTIQTPIIDETLKVIADCQVSIEVNTSGKTKAVGGWYPSQEILERAHHYGVSITFGSDAHQVSRIGEDFDAVQETLKQIGYKHWVYYRKRTPIIVPID